MTPHGSPTRLDRLLPVYDEHEVHSIAIRARPEAIHRALLEVTAAEVPLVRTLLTLRGLRRPGTDGSRPLMASAQADGFTILSDEPGREIVLGVIGRFWGLRDRAIQPIPSLEAFTGFDEPGFARAAMNFWIEPAGPATCQVTTETRVQATDAAARRAFRLYWMVIHPGSALIRLMWLRALKRRAEGAGAAQK